MLLPRLLVATHNLGKVREIRQALDGLIGSIQSQSEIEGAPGAVDETGTTYEANAILKARALFDATGLPTLADDSGLEVEALGGRPGLHSARYGSDDGDRIEKLLCELEPFPEPLLRRARFVCAFALLLPGEEPRIFRGLCPGTILTARRGTGGFGFDPIFQVEEMGRAMAELSTEEKNRVSHRARALESLAAWLGKTERESKA